MVVSIVIITLTVGLLIGAWIYPYVWGSLLKAKMLKRLREEARACGFKYRRFYKNIFFVRNNSPRFDMVIYDDKRLYAVKLWSSYFVRSGLVLSDKGKIFERRESRPVFDMSGGEKRVRYVRSPIRSAVKTRLPKKYMRGREVRNILLIYPSYKSIVYRSGRHEIPVNTGDEILDKVVFSPSAFTAELKKKQGDRG